MYGKLFDSMYKGTLAEDWRALVTFQQMIIMCDQDGTIDVTPRHIASVTGIPIDVIEAGIPLLEQPDPRSRTPDEDGKRIIRLDEHRDWGWYIVNHEKYKKLVDSTEIRDQNRERKRRQRAREKAAKESQEVTPVTPCHAPSRHTDTDTDTKTPLSVPDAQMVVSAYKQSLPNHQQPVMSRWKGSVRERELRARWKENPEHRKPEFWDWFFATVTTNPHWMGKNDREWKPDIEWLLKRANFDKVIQRGENNAER